MTYRHERRDAEKHEAHGYGLDDGEGGGGASPRACARGAVQQPRHLLANTWVAHGKSVTRRCLIVAHKTGFSENLEKSAHCDARVCTRHPEAAFGAGAGWFVVLRTGALHEMLRFPKTALTLVETAVALRDGSTTAFDLLQVATKRMAVTRHLNAFIGGVLPNAAKQAEESDARRGRDSGVDLGANTEEEMHSTSHSLLDGAPIAVKDNFFVPGAPTTAASKFLKGFAPPNFESTVTRRLANAGSTLFAKTNMDEFGMGSSNKNSAFGSVINPFNAAVSDEDEYHPQSPRVAGGSSGGSACAVASGTAVAAIGSDTGGSVRLPASYCGLVGFKPTFGRVSRWGLVPYVSSLDCPGFITKTVTDALVLVGATQGHDPLDPMTSTKCHRIDQMVQDIEASVASTADNKSKSRGYLKSSPGHPLAGWRVGIPAEYMLHELSEEVRSAWIATGKVCENLGAQLVSVSLPNTANALAAYYVIAPVEAASNLSRYDGVRFGSEQLVTGEDDDAYAQPDLSQLDSSQIASPFHRGATLARSVGFGDEVKRRILVGTYAGGNQHLARYVEKAQKVRRAVSDDFKEVFKKVDVLLTPTAPTVAPELYPEVDLDFLPEESAGEESSSGSSSVVSGYAADALTVPASLAGLPALSLPVGLGYNSGLPIGVQIIASKGGDADVLGFGMALEKAVRGLGDAEGGVGPMSEGALVGWSPKHFAVGVGESMRFHE